MKRPDPIPNPWRLTPRQVQVMRALVKCGCCTRAAADLGLSIKTVNNHLQTIKMRMKVEALLLAAVEFDRFERGWTC